jgi:hypothetical protein
MLTGNTRPDLEAITRDLPGHTRSTFWLYFVQETDGLRAVYIFIVPWFETWRGHGAIHCLRELYPE